MDISSILSKLLFLIFYSMEEDQQLRQWTQKTKEAILKDGMKPICQWSQSDLRNLSERISFFYPQEKEIIAKINTFIETKYLIQKISSRIVAQALPPPPPPTEFERFSIMIKIIEYLTGSAIATTASIIIAIYFTVQIVALNLEDDQTWIKVVACGFIGVILLGLVVALILIIYVGCKARNIRVFYQEVKNHW